MGTLQTFLKRRGKPTPKKDEFGDAAAELEKRAAEMRTGFRTQVTDPMAELVDSLATFVRAIGSASAAADRATNIIKWMTAVGLLVAATNVWLVWVQINESNYAINAQNAIALNGQFFHDPINIQIIDAIESHKPILIQNHGYITPTELDNYLGDFETIDNAYGEKQLSEGQLCASFATIVVETFDNPEIQKYLRDSPSYFGGAVGLREFVKKSKLDDCH